MRVIADVIGVVLLIQGIGGLLGPHVPMLSEEFGLLPHVADGGALTGLQLAAIVLGMALVAVGRVGRKAESPS
ncbi:hypothetical protein [Phytoactinopolyspora endophytica]|uniref:hypothetical protein n=1 Tax=Phytoactinopolyspora endophytica TaxID=1642495 RepID=UPI00101D3ECF|nr:hypothetical protein [Phytoactinopolyspora endophytica]